MGESLKVITNKKALNSIMFPTLGTVWKLLGWGGGADPCDVVKISVDPALDLEKKGNTLSFNISK